MMESRNTRFARSEDGTRIAFDSTGNGPAVVLLHGGGQSRHDWHRTGYVERLKAAYQVIAIDIRGNGDSDKPVDSAAYSAEKLGDDILAVADACGVERFVIWGFSYGGNIGRYLAARSQRVAGIAIVGIPFGLGASGAFRATIEGMLEHWTPILEAQREGKLDADTLSDEDRAILAVRNMALDVAWLGAMLEWHSVTPQDLRARVLWLIGSENDSAMKSLKEYEATLGPHVRAQVVEGLTHMDEFTEIDKVLPAMMAFTDSVWMGQVLNI